jgi:hypothetical protein
MVIRLCGSVIIIFVLSLRKFLRGLRPTTREAAHVAHGPAIQSFETPLLGRSELGGNLERGQVAKGVAYAVQLGLELHGPGRQRWRRRLVHRASRTPQQLLAAGRVGYSPRLHEAQ